MGRLEVSVIVSVYSLSITTRNECNELTYTVLSNQTVLLGLSVKQVQTNHEDILNSSVKQHLLFRMHIHPSV